MSSLNRTALAGERAVALLASYTSRVSPQSWVATITAALVLAVVAGAGGGEDATWTSYTEIGLILLGGATVCICILKLSRERKPKLFGIEALVAFALLTGLTGLSVAWSFDPNTSWLETNRTLSYLAVFAGAIALVRLVGHRWAGVIHGLSVACLLICLWGLATHVLPEFFAPDDTYARIRAPFGYWNATGLIAAMGVMPMLWLGARRSGHLAFNALAWPAVGLLLVTLLLSYSRGGLLALGCGLAIWFAVVPLRLRSFAVLSAGAFAALPIVAWAFANPALSQDNIALDERVTAGHQLGLLLLLLAVGLLIAGLATNFITAVRSPAWLVRRRTGKAILCGIAVVPIVALVVLAISPGGVSGQIDQTVNALTKPNGSTPKNTPGRLATTSSERARYWNEALDIYANNKAVGSGAGAFATARLRYRTTELKVHHAHGYIVQTLADLGLVGLGLSLVGALAWFFAATKACALRFAPRRRRVAWTPERVGMLSLFCMVIIFSVHSLIDWTWFMAADAVIALFAAGWLAGRGPITKPLSPLIHLPGVRRSLQLFERKQLAYMATNNPGPLAATLCVGAIAITGAWMAWQPVRSINELSSANSAVERGTFTKAERLVHAAIQHNPLAVEPLWELASIQQAQGKRVEALATYRRATSLAPANPATWHRLGLYRLEVMGHAKVALRDLGTAVYLDPRSKLLLSDFLKALRQFEQEEAMRSAQTPKGKSPLISPATS